LNLDFSFFAQTDISSACIICTATCTLSHRFLQELGWKENEESDEDVGIPEQDPAQLQYIMQEVGTQFYRLYVLFMNLYYTISY